MPLLPAARWYASYHGGVYRCHTHTYLPHLHTTVHHHAFTHHYPTPRRCTRTHLRCLHTHTHPYTHLCVVPGPRPPFLRSPHLLRAHSNYVSTTILYTRAYSTCSTLPHIAYSVCRAHVPFARGPFSTMAGTYGWWTINVYRLSWVPHLFLDD